MVCLFGRTSTKPARRVGERPSYFGFDQQGLNEKGFDADVIEAALAHSDKDEVRSAYNRTDYLDRRREMMAWWSKHIEQAASVGSALTWKPSVIAS